MLLKSLSRSVSKVSGKVPLRIILVVPFVLQIFGAVGLVGYLSFRNGQSAVNDVATQLRQEVTARIEQNLRAYLAIPHQVNQSNAAAINLGQLNLQDLPGLERHFWRQLQIFDTLTFAGLGFENRDNLGIEKLDDNSLTIRVSTKTSGYDFRTYSTNELGDRLKLLNHKLNFDPRTRPWYKAAVAAGQSTWSQIYPNTAGITSYLGASLPFYDKQGKLQGVLLSNINLSKIGNFLRSLKIGKTGQVFIIERGGMLVATSTGEKPFRTTKKEYGAEQVKATDSSNPLTQATAQYLAANFNPNRPIQSLQQLEFRLEGKRQFLQVQPFQDKFGLDWLIVVVVPEADFMEQINANTRANDYLTKPFSKNELLARIKTHIRLAKINAAYGRFVPHHFLRFLGRESIVDVKLGDHVQKDMTILFSDIRSFTSLSEGMSPEENFNFINSYLSRVSPVIRAHNGFIDKYIGDAVMALFPESADDAILGAIAMQKQVVLYNQHRQKHGYVPIAIGIGLHTGSLMLGTIGEQERMESTVIADAVNLASRLEGLTKLYAAGILISEQTLLELDEPKRYSYRFLDRVKVEGKNTAVAVFEVYDGDSQLLKQLKTKTKTSFEKAVFLYYQQQFAKSQQVFQEILQTNTQDKAAMLYVKRCEHYQKYGVPEEWEGVEALTEK